MPVDDVNVLVTFYSRGGETERLAVLIAEGAVQAGARIRLRRTRDIAPAEVIGRHPEWLAARDRMHLEYAAPGIADAIWADAFCFGTPATFGSLSPELGSWLDCLRGETAFAGKIATAFTSTYQPRPGSECTVASLQAALLHHQLIVAPAPVSAVIDDFERARLHGRSITGIARALKQLTKR